MLGVVVAVAIAVCASAGPSVAQTPFDSTILEEMARLGLDRERSEAAIERLSTLLPQRREWARQARMTPPFGSALRDGTWTGRLSVAVVDQIDEHGQLNESRVYFTTLNSRTTRVVPFGSAPPDSLDGRRVRIRGLKAGQTLVSEEIEALALAGPGGGGAAAAPSAVTSCETIGPQTGLIIAVNYLDDTGSTPSLTTLDDLHFAETSSLRDYWRETSYGAIDLTGDSLGWYTLDINSAQACDAALVRTKALERAALDTDLTQYNRVFIVMRDPVPDCGWTGAASLSCLDLPTPDGTIDASTFWVMASSYLDPTEGVWLSAHEAGHNLGLGHASVRDFGLNGIGPTGQHAQGTLVGYGNRYDSMGNAGTPGHYHARHKDALTWLQPAEILKLNGDATVTIDAIASPASPVPKAVRLYRGVDPASFNKEYLWFELRQPVGYDTTMDPRGVDSVLVYSENDHPTTLAEQLDLHPDTDTGAEDYFDAGLLPGEDFSDPYSGMTISHQGLDPSGDAVVAVSVLPASLDTDEDGLGAGLEATIGTDPALEDTDADGLTDYEEICFDGDCLSFGPGDVDPTAADTDGDLLPDGWELTHGFEPLTANGSDDPDADGLTNVDEFANDTDPGDPDTDGDSLGDSDEVNLHGTDPLSSDSDGDGLPDAWEISTGIDPLIVNDAADPDTDGLTNFEEYTANSDPFDADSDDDGLDDLAEVTVHFTDPGDPDSDDDRVGDAEEVNISGTDPLSAIDTDNDGMWDDWETARGTDGLVIDARLDPDGDGVDNIVEFFRDTLPQDDLSTPLLTPIHVDPSNQSGTEDGTPAYPYSTIDAAIAVAQDGDSVLLAAGSYPSTGFVSERAIRILGPPDRSAILDASGSIALVGPTWGGLSNLTISPPPGQSALITAVDGRNLLFENCLLPEVKILSFAKASHARIVNTLVHAAGQPQGVFVGSNSALELASSTIVGFPIGLQLQNATASASILNSILSNTVDLAGVLDASGVSYSLIADGQFAGQNGIIDDDPLFVDAANDDYHLQTSSPAVDAGDPAASVAGEPPPHGCRLNLGAFGGTGEAAASPDPDDDGLDGYCEAIAGTDPDHPDTDHDGILDGADVAPLDLFSPNGEGLVLARDAAFLELTSSYSTTDTLYLLSWSNVVGAGASDASYILVGGSTTIDASFTDHGDGSYSASQPLSALNYAGPDVTLDTRLENPPDSYLDQRIISLIAPDVPPVVAINAPTEAAAFGSAVLIDFEGSANDAEDGDLSPSLDWSSDLDGPLGVGGILASTLSIGSHTITASVTDSGGNPAQDAVSITVTAEPVVAISAPTDAASVVAGSVVSFAATANDPEDGDVSATLSWSSDLDGVIGTGPAFDLTTLSVGTHEITATATDTLAVPGTDLITLTILANAAPVVTITEPADATSAAAGVLVGFAATAVDAEDGDVSATLSWSSDLDGVIGTGGAVNAVLSVGTHVVTAAVLDGAGLPGQATLGITVNANTPPTVTLTSPPDPTTVTEGTSIAFAATASDLQDGDLTPALTWTSDLDGALGTGGAFLASLSMGTHLVTASVLDAGGLPGQATVGITVDANTPASVTLTSPLDPTTVAEGASIAFAATALDLEDGDLTAALTWSSDLDGAIGTGGAFNAVLAIGTHVVTAAVLDAGGLQSQATVGITVDANDPPSVVIVSPQDPLTVSRGATIDFNGTATDLEDGDLTAIVAWASDVDGPIGTGGSFGTTLTVGTHVVTATATDSLGLPGDAMVVVTVQGGGGFSCGLGPELALILPLLGSWRRRLRSRPPQQQKSPPPED